MLHKLLQNILGYKANVVLVDEIEAAFIAAGYTPPAKPPAEAPPQKPFAHLSDSPAVPISESVQHEYIICLFDGSPRKMLKRHIRAKYNMSEDQYRAFWNLPDDYPMVAPKYSDLKRDEAYQVGLGHHPRRSRRPDVEDNGGPAPFSL